ncbi:hypothetical protein N0V88_007788 [Collariella sp. IMI 366227]|nr:hypothetical protein N0V88_007788 [Collariella sp. IMI 366227]
MALVVFLALKNTPLAFLTAHSYEKLNSLHQIAGYTMFVLLVLHAALYTAYFQGQGRLKTQYSEPKEIAAIVSGFAILGGVLSAIVLPRLRYEAFYITHICCWIAAVIAMGFHQPDLGKKALVVTVFTAAIWVADRLVRLGRIVWFGVNNEATIHPLPNGATKIVLKKALARAKPGTHCFLWVPAISRFQTHPFTMHRSSPVEFTVMAREGFTKRLHDYAVVNPGATVRASVDGPYGSFPDPLGFDKVVLVAGGGGGSFTFGLALSLLERMEGGLPKKIMFIWAVKETENLTWFQSEIDLLRTHTPHTVEIRLFVTRAASSQTTLQAGESDLHLFGVAPDSDSTTGTDSELPSSLGASDPEKKHPPFGVGVCQ